MMRLLVSWGFPAGGGCDARPRYSRCNCWMPARERGGRYVQGGRFCGSISWALSGRDLLI